MDRADIPPDVPLVLLPGMLCDERVFGPLIERLPKREIIVGDMTGAFSTPDQARRILSATPHRFALAGFSLGGIVALEMIAQAPERIERLALIDTTARADPEANASVRRRAVERAREDGIETYIADSWPKPVSPVHAAAPELRDLLIAMAEKGGAEVLASQSEVAIHRADSRPRLKDIAVPTLVLCGADDGVCLPAVHREMANLIPGAVLAVIPEAGHFALVENPDAVAAEIGTWLAAPVAASAP